MIQMRRSSERETLLADQIWKIVEQIRYKEQTRRDTTALYAVLESILTEYMKMRIKQYILLKRF